jgi:heme/copper-type cytochrome/quinol oxidase subunit 1
MSTLDPTLDQPMAADATPSSIVAALTSSDHKVIGRLLIVSSLVVALATGVIGLLLGADRIGGDGTLLRSAVVPELFGGYRLGLVFGVAVPLMLGISVLAVPLQLGARSLAFPRLAAAGLWTWLGGVVVVVIAVSNNGGTGGGDLDMVRLYVGGSALMALGLTAVAGTVATSVLTTRAPGMRLHRTPLFAWSALVHSLGLVLVLPVWFGASVYLYMDVRYGNEETTLFGGAVGVGDWSSWLLTGPSLALYAVPAIGLVAELLPVAFRRRLPMRGVAMTAVALVGVGMLGGVTQLRQVVLPGTGPGVSGRNWLTKLGILVDWGIFTLLPALGVVTVVGLGALLARPQARAGRARRRPSAPRLLAPLVFGVLGAVFVLLGVLAVAMNGIEDLALAGTVFEEGAAAAVIYGTVLGGLGALAYWSPKWNGRRPADLPLIGVALVGALGTALASVPYLIAGFADQPGYSVVYANEGPGELWNTAVTIGHGLVGLTVLAVAALLSRPGPAAAGDDPWDGHTLEWAVPSPAPARNFATTPLVRSPEPLLDLKVDRGSNDVAPPRTAPR